MFSVLTLYKHHKILKSSRKPLRQKKLPRYERVKISVQSKRIPLSPIACSLQVYKSVWEEWLWSNPSYWLPIAKVLLISPDLVMPTKSIWSFGAMISFCVSQFQTPPVLLPGSVSKWAKRISFPILLQMENYSTDFK